MLLFAFSYSRLLRICLYVGLWLSRPVLQLFPILKHMFKNGLIITWGRPVRTQSVNEEDYFATFRCLKLENIKCSIVRLDSKPFQLKSTDRDPHQ